MNPGNDRTDTLLEFFKVLADEKRLQIIGLLSRQDYTVEKDGLRFAATHVLAEFWGARHLDDVDAIEDAIRTAAETAGATVLHGYFHQFSSTGGVSGVAVLAESHISVHTWPEREFAAFDVFMCGNSKPEKTIDVLKQRFEPARTNIIQHARGMMQDEA